VVAGLNLHLPNAQVHGLVGLNGSGKTTLLQLICGRPVSQSGRVQWQGEKPSHRSVAFLETTNYFYHYMTGQEYLELFAHQNPKFDVAAFNALFQLPLNQLTDTHSTEMKKKLAFMVTLSLDRPLIILDEPFNGVDLETSFLFNKAIGLLRQRGKTVIVTLHIYESLTGLCDQIHHLVDGNIGDTYQQENFGELGDKMLASPGQQYQDKWDKARGK